MSQQQRNRNKPQQTKYRPKGETNNNNNNSNSNKNYQRNDERSSPRFQPKTGGNQRNNKNYRNQNNRYANKNNQQNRNNSRNNNRNNIGSNNSPYMRGEENPNPNSRFGGNFRSSHRNNTNNNNMNTNKNRRSPNESPLRFGNNLRNNKNRNLIDSMDDLSLNGNNSTNNNQMSNNSLNSNLNANNTLNRNKRNNMNTNNNNSSMAPPGLNTEENDNSRSMEGDWRRSNVNTNNSNNNNDYSNNSNTNPRRQNNNRNNRNLNKGSPKMLGESSIVNDSSFIDEYSRNRNDKVAYGMIVNCLEDKLVPTFQNPKESIEEASNVYNSLYTEFKNNEKSESEEKKKQLFKIEDLLVVGRIPQFQDSWPYNVIPSEIQFTTVLRNLKSNNQNVNNTNNSKKRFVSKDKEFQTNSPETSNNISNNLNTNNNTNTNTNPNKQNNKQQTPKQRPSNVDNVNWRKNSEKSDKSNKSETNEEIQTQIQSKDNNTNNETISTLNIKTPTVEQEQNNNENTITETKEEIVTTKEESKEEIDGTSNTGKSDETQPVLEISLDAQKLESENPTTNNNNESGTTDGNKPKDEPEEPKTIRLVLTPQQVPQTTDNIIPLMEPLSDLSGMPTNQEIEKNLSNKQKITMSNGNLSNLTQTEIDNINEIEDIKPTNITPELKPNPNEIGDIDIVNDGVPEWGIENEDEITLKGDFVFKAVDKEKDRKHLEIHGSLPTNVSTITNEEFYKQRQVLPQTQEKPLSKHPQTQTQTRSAAAHMIGVTEIDTSHMTEEERQYIIRQQQQRKQQTPLVQPQTQPDSHVSSHQVSSTVPPVHTHVESQEVPQLPENYEHYIAERHRKFQSKDANLSEIPAPKKRTIQKYMNKHGVQDWYQRYIWDYQKFLLQHTSRYIGEYGSESSRVRQMQSHGTHSHTQHSSHSRPVVIGTEYDVRSGYPHGGYEENPVSGAFVEYSGQQPNEYDVSSQHHSIRHGSHSTHPHTSSTSSRHRIPTTQSEQSKYAPQGNYRSTLDMVDSLEDLVYYEKYYMTQLKKWTKLIPQNDKYVDYVKYYEKKLGIVAKKRQELEYIKYRKMEKEKYLLERESTKVNNTKTINNSNNLNLQTQIQEIPKSRSNSPSQSNCDFDLGALGYTLATQQPSQMYGQNETTDNLILTQQTHTHTHSPRTQHITATTTTTTKTATVHTHPHPHTQQSGSSDNSQIEGVSKSQKNQLNPGTNDTTNNTTTTNETNKVNPTETTETEPTTNNNTNTTTNEDVTAEKKATKVLDDHWEQLRSELMEQARNSPHGHTKFGGVMHKGYLVLIISGQKQKIPYWFLQGYELYQRKINNSAQNVQLIGYWKRYLKYKYQQNMRISQMRRLKENDTTLDRSRIPPEPQLTVEKKGFIDCIEHCRKKDKNKRQLVQQKLERAHQANTMTGQQPPQVTGSTTATTSTQPTSQHQVSHSHSHLTSQSPPHHISNNPYQAQVPTTSTHGHPHTQQQMSSRKYSQMPSKTSHTTHTTRTQSPNELIGPIHIDDPRQRYGNVNYYNEIDERQYGHSTHTSHTQSQQQQQAIHKSRSPHQYLNEKSPHISSHSTHTTNQNNVSQSYHTNSRGNRSPVPPYDMYGSSTHGYPNQQFPSHPYSNSYNSGMRSPQIPINHPSQSDGRGPSHFPIVPETQEHQLNDPSNDPLYHQMQGGQHQQLNQFYY